MALRKDLLRKLMVALLLCPVILCSAVSPVYAATPHENPQASRTLYSAIALFFYYYDSLGFVLQREPLQVEIMLDKMPFANLPPDIEEANVSFVKSSISVANVVVDLDKDVETVRTLLRQSRFAEIAGLSNVIMAHLSTMRTGVSSMKDAAELIAQEFAVFSSPEGSDIRKAYQELLDELEGIEELLDFYFEMLKEELLKLVDSVGQDASPALQQALEGLKSSSKEQLLELAKTLLERQWPRELDTAMLRMLFQSSELTLQIEPMVAFVGDHVRYSGSLTSDEKPLPGKEVTILLDGVPYLTASTDDSGYYGGTLQVPYRYVHEMSFQALYFPQSNDIGRYLSSTSPVVKVKVLFYEATIVLKLPEKAYPGLETAISGQVKYGQYPPLENRKVEIYLDNKFAGGTTAQEAFTGKMKIDPEMEVGEHLLTVSMSPVARYAPTTVSGMLYVTKAKPVIELVIPGVAFIPGSIKLKGKLYSEVGPLGNANVEAILGDSRVKFLSSGDGFFDHGINVGMSLSFMGSRELSIAVRASEPWNDDMVTTRTVPYVNWVSSAGILAMVALLVFYFPRRLRVFGTSRLLPEESPVKTGKSPNPTQQSGAAPAVIPSEIDGDSGEPRSRVYYWYRFSVRIILRVTGSLFRTQQTLREFARETGSMLGPASKYFMELTMLVERLLYSRHVPTEEDAARSKQLTGSINDSVAGSSSAGKV